MEEKYAWAVQTGNAIQQQAFLQNRSGILPAYLREFTEIKRGFWAFLQAYQQIRFYHGSWATQTNMQGKGTLLLDKWKDKFLTTEQAQAWGSLNKLRNADTHAEPVFPDICMRKVIRATNGGVRVTHDGRIRVARVQYLAVRAEGEDYDLLHLVATNMKLMRLFIDTFDQVSLP
jgi:outer membrane translocation and assembly module TamA